MDSLKKFDRILAIVKNIANGLDHPVASQIGDILQKSSILIPSEKGVTTLRNPTFPISILLLAPEDEIKFPQLGGYFKMRKGKGNALATAIYVHEAKVIVLFLDRGISNQYLASVLMHECIHVAQNSESSDLEILSHKELAAHLFHFEIMDFLGSKNPRYSISIEEEGRWALGLFLKNGFPPGLNYEESKRVRRFFESETSIQDKSWYTLWWFRRTFEMFILLNENDLEKAVEDFRLFLKDVYSKFIK